MARTAWNKGLPDFLTALPANWDVLQVGILGIEPAGGGHHLVVGGVYAAGSGPNRQWQGIGIGGLQFGGRAILQEPSDDPSRASVNSFQLAKSLRYHLSPEGLGIPSVLKS